VRALLVIAGLVAMIGACGAPEASRCEPLCARYATCAAERSPEHPERAVEAECVQACAIFERDDEARSQVDERETCVHAAEGCEAVVACFGEG
jgi:Cys-rich protein (TIGR04453 family)